MLSLTLDVTGSQWCGINDLSTITHCKNNVNLVNLQTLLYFYLKIIVFLYGINYISFSKQQEDGEIIIYLFLLILLRRYFRYN